MGKLVSFAARMSVEAIVGLLIGITMIGILTVTIVAGGFAQNGSVEVGKVTGLRHEAMSVPAAEESPSVVLTPDADPGMNQSTDTVVRNGITIVTPHLLIPIIDADAVDTAKAPAAPAFSRKHATTRKRSHYARRAHGQRQWRIVGLAASRRLVTADP
jgi:hypothetical protein